jgi:hypothetical protein
LNGGQGYLPFRPSFITLVPLHFADWTWQSF